MCEVLECDKCRNKVPSTNQPAQTTCWDCGEGVMIETVESLAEFNHHQWQSRLHSIGSILATRNI
jgi:hypothetical protein